MSNNWRYLDVGDHQPISDEMYNYLVNHTDDLADRPRSFYYETDGRRELRHCPLLAEFLKQQDLNPVSLGIIICSDARKLPLHIDFDGIDPWVRILWPVRNCQGSKTQFWRVPAGSGTLFVSKSNNARFTYFPPDQEKEFIEEFELARPAVMNVSQPHNVEANPDAQGLRISFSIGFDRDLPISKSVRAWSGFQR
jgi:hypothetical protein